MNRRLRRLLRAKAALELERETEHIRRMQARRRLKFPNA